MEKTRTSDGVSGQHEDITPIISNLRQWANLVQWLSFSTLFREGCLLVLL
jgi:hypothetical protein